MSEVIETVSMASEEFAEDVSLKAHVLQDASALPEEEEADPRTLYLVPAQKTGVAPESCYDVYFVVGGSWANLSAVDLTGIVRKVNGNTPGSDGAVVLKASDVAYDEPQGGAPEGSVGAKIAAVASAAASAASAASAKYSKPSGGIPSTDMTSGVQTSLGKADSAVQPGDILDGGFIKASVLPSFVDDVLEYASADAFPVTGETGKIYVAKDTNKAYRWSGTQYVEISKSVDVVDPANATVTGKAADALKVKQALAGKASTADAALAERGFTEWTMTDVPEGLDPADVSVDWGDPGSTYGYEAWYFAVPGGWFWTDITDQNITSLADSGFAATRTALSGYQLGNQSEKPLASEAEAEALRTAVAAKYAKPSGGIPKSDLASAVQASLGKADSALQAHQQLNDMTGALHWSVSPVEYDLWIAWEPSSGKWILKQGDDVVSYDGEGNAESLSLFWAAADNTVGVDVTATRQMAGWALGTQTDKPLATAAQGALAQTAVQPSALPASETWTFEVDDGQGGTTTVTKNVAIYAGANA